MAKSVDALTLACRAAAEFGDRAFSFPNVIGHGVGFKRRGGRKTDELCMTVFVSTKLPLSALRPGEALPPRLNTNYGPLAIDVVQEAIPSLGVDNDSYRPVLGGCQITAAASGGSGTLGAVMYDETDAETVLLTCNHCLTPAGQRTTLPFNTRVSQPTIGSPIGRTKRIAPWFRTPLGDFEAAWQCRVDAGIVSLDSTIDASFRVIDIGKHPYVPLPPSLGLEVRKRGFVSELTTGTVENINLSFIIRDFNNDLARIGGEGSGFSIRSPKDSMFFVRGDSGSLVVDADGGAARGLAFAGQFTNGGLSFACQLSAIMEELQLETPCTGSMNAVFRRALRRRFMLSTIGNVDTKLYGAASGNVKKFRAKYLKAAPTDSMGAGLEAFFQSFATEMSEALVSDEDFAGLLDLAVGDWLVQPTVFDMLEYVPPEDMHARLAIAFDRLREVSPEASDLSWIAKAFADSRGQRMRDLLARQIPFRVRPSKPSRRLRKA